MDDSGDLSHDKIWFIKRGSKVFGPFAAARVRHFLVEKKIELQDAVSKDRRNWKQIHQVPEVVPLMMRDPHALDEAGTTDELDPGKKGSLWLPILFVVILIAAGLVVSVMLQGDNQQAVTVCTAAPAAGVNWNGCNKKGLQAEGANLDGMLASNAVMVDARLSGASMKSADLRYANLYDSDLSYVNLDSANLKGADLHNVDFSYAILNNTNLRYADLTNTRLGGVELRNAQLDGAIWSNGKACKPGSVGKCVQ